MSVWKAVIFGTVKGEVYMSVTIISYCIFFQCGAVCNKVEPSSLLALLAKKKKLCGIPLEKTRYLSLTSSIACMIQ